MLLAEKGCTKLEIAEMLDVVLSTVYLWADTYPDFSEALKRGCTVADDNVVRSLYKRAMGYEHEAVKIMQYEGEPVEVKYTKHYPPDSTALIFWLANRDPANWRRNRDADILDDGGNVTTDFDVEVIE